MPSRPRSCRRRVGSSRRAPARDRRGLLARRRRADRGGRPRSVRRRPRTPRRPTPHRHHGRRRRRRTPSTPDDEAPSPTGRRRSRRARIDWQQFDDQLDTGAARGPDRLRRPRRRHVRAVPRAPPGRPTRTPGSARCSSTPAGRASAGRRSPPRPSSVYDEELLEHFDIVGWDPRGTGYTTPAIDCIDDYDEYFAGTDITPDDDAERQQIIDLAEDFEDQCVTKNADILQHIGTNDSARDIDSIRRRSARTRSPTSGSATAASWARRGRRSSPTPSAPPCSTAPPTRRSG